MLACDAAEVAVLVAGADVFEGGVAVHVLAAGWDVDGLKAVVVGRVGIVVDGLGDGDVDAADRVDNVADAL